MEQIKEVPVEEIQVGEYEQRLAGEDSELDGLAASISRLGVLVPLILQKKGDSFQLVSGHRRLLAAMRVGLSVVPCFIKDSAEVNSSEVTFAENFFRKDLSQVELAGAIRDAYADGGLSIEELAAGFHKSEHWVRQMMAILSWPKDVLQLVHERLMSLSAASNLALITDDEYRNFLLQNAVVSGATARTTASWLQAWREMQPVSEAITLEPVGLGPSCAPAMPQAPCFCCTQLFEVDQVSYVPICSACVQIIRKVGSV